MSVLLLMLSGTLPSLVGPVEGLARHSQCSDGKDNDDDRRFDYPEDNDCESLDDDFEGIGGSGVFIAVTDGRDTVRPGDSVTYVISLRQQRDQRRMVNVDLHIPFQANGVNASEGGYVRGNIIRWDNVTIPRDATKRLTVSMNIVSGAVPGTLLVTRVLSEGSEATDTTMVDKPSIPYGPALRMTLSDGKEFVRPDDEITYTLKLTNVSGRELSETLRFMLPAVTTLVSATGTYEKTADLLRWFNVTLAPNESRTYIVRVRVDKRVTDSVSIRARASYGSTSDVDDTVVRRDLLPGSISVSISDNVSQARKGDLLTYHVRVRNTSTNISANTSVDATFPVYNEFVSATEGGTWDGRNVRWLNLPVAPSGVRNLQFTVRVRSDAPLMSDLLATVRASGQSGRSTDQDLTTVVSRTSPYAADVIDNAGTAVVTAGPLAALRTPQKGGPGVMFRKLADRAEAVAGGTIRYTIVVKNTLDRVIDDATVSDRFDPSLMSSPDAPAGLRTFAVPTLRPGAEWRVSYTLHVSEAIVNGTMLSNIATLQGSDIESVPLSERVRVTQTGIMTSMPQTGAPLDAAFVLMTSGVAFGSACASRRKPLGA